MKPITLVIEERDMNSEGNRESPTIRLTDKTGLEEAESTRNKVSAEVTGVVNSKFIRRRVMKPSRKRPLPTKDFRKKSNHPIVRSLLTLESTITQGKSIQSKRKRQRTPTIPSRIRATRVTERKDSMMRSLVDIEMLREEDLRDIRGEMKRTKALWKRKKLQGRHWKNSRPSKRPRRKIW